MPTSVTASASNSVSNARPLRRLVGSLLLALGATAGISLGVSGVVLVRSLALEQHVAPRHQHAEGLRSTTQRAALAMHQLVEATTAPTVHQQADTVDRELTLAESQCAHLQELGVEPPSAVISQMRAINRTLREQMVQRMATSSAVEAAMMQVDSAIDTLIYGIQVVGKSAGESTADLPPLSSAGMLSLYAAEAIAYNMRSECWKLVMRSQSAAEVASAIDAIIGLAAGLNQRLTEALDEMDDAGRDRDATQTRALMASLASCKGRIKGAAGIDQILVGSLAVIDKLRSEIASVEIAIAKGSAVIGTIVDQAQAEQRDSIRMIVIIAIAGSGVLLSMSLLAGAGSWIYARRIASAILATEDERNREEAELAQMIVHVSSIAERVQQAARELEQASGSLSSTAGKSRDLGGNMVTEAGSIAGNLASLAKASFELKASAAGIRDHAHEANGAAVTAADRARQADTQVVSFNAVCTQIKDSVKDIVSLANSARLLAMNATIQAERAGSAGRGFSVVASQVKQLADRIHTTTETIGTRIVEIAGGADAATVAVGAITSQVGTIQSLQGGIASAIEHQSATTDQMSSAIESAHHAGVQMKLQIDSVAAGIALTATTAEDVQRLASDLSKTASELRERCATRHAPRP